MQLFENWKEDGHFQNPKIIISPVSYCHFQKFKSICKLLRREMRRAATLKCSKTSKRENQYFQNILKRNL